jgi:hypothetical protein
MNRVDRMAETSSPSQESGFVLEYDSQRRLVLIDNQGQRHVDVEPVRCFPISHPSQWISICDVQGRELACVNELDSLPGDVRRILEDELAIHEFVPIVVRILDVQADSESSRWKVETDRGPISFSTNDDSAVRQLDQGRAMIVDSSGIRYLIPVVDALDAPSRAILDQYW